MAYGGVCTTHGHLEYDHVERETPGPVVGAPLAELVVGRTCHDLGEGVTRGWRTTIDQVDNSDTLKLGVPVRWRVVVGQLLEEVRRNERYDQFSWRSK